MVVLPEPNQKDPLWLLEESMYQRESDDNDEEACMRGINFNY